MLHIDEELPAFAASEIRPCLAAAAAALALTSSMALDQGPKFLAYRPNVLISPHPHKLSTP